MAFDAFIRIDGIEGESSDDMHQGRIEVVSYETDVKQNVSSTASSAGGASVGRNDFGAVSIVKLQDKSTPLLLFACASGKHIDKIIVHLCRSGGDKTKFMEYELTNCLISRVSVAGGGGEFPHEVVDIDFGKIKWIYSQQKRDGGGIAGQVATGWDRQKNCKV